jgi:hypothetical protein
MVCAETSSRLECVHCFMVKADIPRPLTRSQKLNQGRGSQWLIERANKKRPERQPCPDCPVAQLTLGTPLSLLAAPHERPEKIRYAEAAVGPGPNQRNSRAKSG